MTSTSGRCPRCAGDMTPGVTTYWEEAAPGGAVLIENIPALVCGQCHYAAYTLAIAAEIERLLRERPTPSRTMTVPVYNLTGAAHCMPA